MIYTPCGHARSEDGLHGRVNRLTKNDLPLLETSRYACGIEHLVAMLASYGDAQQQAISYRVETWS